MRTGEGGFYAFLAETQMCRPQLCTWDEMRKLQVIQRITKCIQGWS